MASVQRQVYDYLLRIGVDTVKAKEATRDIVTMTRTTRSLGDEFTRLARRAAMVIPVWYALRRVYVGLINTVSEGLQYWVEMDKEMMRVSMTMGDFPNKGAVLEKVFKRATQLANETGQSAEKIIRAFYQFKTLGLSVEESFAGMEASAKGAVAMMEDTKTLSEVLARSYKLLGQSMTNNLPIQDALIVSLGKIYKLFQTNDFVMGEFSRSIARFLPFAKTMNFTFDEMVAYLAALHSGQIRASRAGRLFGSTLIGLAQKLPQIANILGLKINLNVERFPEVLERVIERLKELQGIDYQRAENALSALFSVRRGYTVRDLLAVLDVVRKNLQDVRNMTAEEAKATFFKVYYENLRRINVQLDRMRQLRRAIGREFIIGFVGGKDFEDSLRRINRLLELIEKNAREAGEALKITLIAIAAGTLTAALSNWGKLGDILSKIPLLGRILPGLAQLMKGPFGLGFGTTVATEAFIRGLLKLGDVGVEQIRKSTTTVEDFNEALKKLREGKLSFQEVAEWQKKLYTDKDFQKRLLGLGLSPEAFDTLRKYFVDAYNKMLRDIAAGKPPTILKSIVIDETFEKITGELKRQVNLLKDQIKYIDIQIAGYNKIEIAQETLNDYIDNLILKNKSLITSDKGRVEIVTREQVLTSLLRGDLSVINKLVADQKERDSEVLKIWELIVDVVKAARQEVESLSEELRTSLTDALTDVFRGTGTLGDVFEAMGEKIRDMYARSLAEGITESLWKVTGMGSMFGNIFFGFRHIGSSITAAGEYHARIVGDTILKAGKAHADMVAQASRGENVTVPTLGSIYTGYGGIGMGGGFAALGNFLGFLNYPAFYTYGPREQIGSYYGYRKYPGPTWGQLAGLGIGTYAATLGGGPLMGAGTMFAGLGQLAQAGLIRGSVGSFLSSWGGPIGMALSTMAMLFGIGKAREQTQEQQRTFQITSRIDVTNKNLEIVNRNLVALRNDIRTYILPSSAYFAEKRNIEDQFAVDAMRGY